jgi:hypothetical protein
MQLDSAMGKPPMQPTCPLTVLLLLLPQVLDIARGMPLLDPQRLTVLLPTVLLLLLLLQVLDIATGKPLLDPPLASCAGGLTWWGQDSSTLLYTAEVRPTTAEAARQIRKPER